MKLSSVSFLISLLVSGALSAPAASDKTPKPDSTKPPAQAEKPGPSKEHAHLAELRAQNQAWIKEFKALEPAFFTGLARPQQPKTLWIGCSDSRVPETTIFGGKPGDFFVQRNIGHQFHANDSNVLAVLTYGLTHISPPIEHIVVAGHTDCGAVKTSYKQAGGAGKKRASGALQLVLEQWLTPLTAHAKSVIDGTVNASNRSVEFLIEDNVRKQVENIANSELVAGLRKDGKQVHVHGLVYDVGTGLMTNFNVTNSPTSAPPSASKSRS